jgi:broad specificity phosphatase PhoE
MSMKKTLVLVRHGSMGSEFEGRFIGKTDPSLAPEGCMRVKAMTAHVHERKPERCLCSPRRRALETAEILIDALGLGIAVDSDLEEVDFGRWEGMSFEEIVAADPELVNRWAAWDESFAFPGGESLSHFLERVNRMADRMVTDTARIILAVTHGGVIRAIVCHLLGLSGSHHLAFDVRPASVTVLEVVDGRGVLTGLNNFSLPGEP